MAGGDVLLDVLGGEAEGAVGVRKRRGLRRAVALTPASLEFVAIVRDERGDPILQQLGIGDRPFDERVPEVEDDRLHRFFLSFSTCFQVRVLTTSAFVSQARRAWPTPSST